MPHTWAWSSGEAIQQTFWSDGEPNGAHEKCAIMDPTGGWRDMMCSMWPYPFICQQQTLRVNSSLKLTYFVEELNTTSFQVLWRSPALNATSTPNTVQGFELAWNISEVEVDNT